MKTLRPVFFIAGMVLLYLYGHADFEHMTRTDHFACLAGGVCLMLWAWPSEEP